MTPDLGKLKQLAEDALLGPWGETEPIDPSTVLALIARIEALEAGLKPFAAEADEWWAELPDSYVPGTVEARVVYPGIAGGDAKYTIGDLRRAANLLSDRLCEDEGCPHHGTPHVCLNPGDRHD